MKFARLWGVSSRVAITGASCSVLTCLLAAISLLRSDCVSHDMVTGEESQGIVDPAEERLYVVTVVVVAAVVVAAVVVAAVVVAAVVVAAVVVAAVVVTAVVVAGIMVAGMVVTAAVV